MVTLSMEAYVGIILTVVALLGAAAGTVSAVLAATGPRERRYLIGGYLSLWIISLIAIPVCILAEFPWNYLLLGDFFLLIPAGAFRITRRAHLIARTEREQAE